tara:strand:+ start:1325 stop:2341 length:1017 start_codon:yes stop_codon:yes gene_type:complete
MATATLASNIGGMAGKWLPYYFKPFLLGRYSDGQGSTDGGTYITQTTGTSNEALRGSCTSDFNCAYYYTITFSSTSKFQVKKYDLNDNLIDTICASATSGDGRYWDMVSALASDKNHYTIDIGVNIYIPVANAFDLGDVYKITLPTFEQMQTRKIYHGGYSAFLRMPWTENTATNSDILPSNLDNKTISMVFNPPLGMVSTIEGYGLALCASDEDSGGNSAVSANLTLSVNESASNAIAADTGTAYTWASGEEWALSTTLASDLDPTHDTSEDFPAVGIAPAGDTVAASATTGELQGLPLTCSLKGGYQKIRLSYESGSGSTRITAYNQFWPIILLIH